MATSEKKGQGWWAIPPSEARPAIY